jgi:hypothetical protein
MGVFSLRLIVEGTIIIIVPLIASFLFHAVSLLALVFYLAACISITDDITQVLVIPVSSSAAFLRWSETAG